MAKADRPHVIGLISDTHGQLRAGVHQALEGVELILHAGDVGGDDILDELALIAPVEAVYGNTDTPGNPRLERADRARDRWRRDSGSARARVRTTHCRRITRTL